eukprot:scaffold277240_cov28-Tisochrysis_lutea.AAC.1
MHGVVLPAFHGTQTVSRLSIASPCHPSAPYPGVLFVATWHAIAMVPSTMFVAGQAKRLTSLECTAGSFYGMVAIWVFLQSQEPPYKTLCMCHMCAAWEVSTFPGQGHIPCKHCRQAAEHP